VIWNAESGAAVATFKGHSQEVASLAFAGKGGILATGSSDQTLRLWDVTRLLPAQP
jgi:WD40 repeat protein